MNYFKQSGYFLHLSIGMLLLGIIAIIATEKGDLYLELNQSNTPAFDFLFKWITHLGDGLFFLLVSFLLLFNRIQLFFLSLIVFAATGLVSQLLKRLVFASSIRPAKFFENLTDLHHVEGVKLYEYFSFPSGHSAIGFALFTMLSILINNKFLSVLFFVIAVLIGLSRIYLSKHFLEDVVAGAAIGVFLTILCHKFVSNSSWYNKKAWMHLSLQKALMRNDKA